MPDYLCSPLPPQIPQLGGGAPDGPDLNCDSDLDTDPNLNLDDEDAFNPFAKTQMSIVTMYFVIILIVEVSDYEDLKDAKICKDYREL